MRKRITLLGIAVILMLFISGCSSGAYASEYEEHDQTEISVVLKTLSSPYWKYIEAGAKDAGQDLGVKVNVVGPSSEQLIMEQVNLIDDQLIQNPDVLILAPIQPEAVANSLERTDIPYLTIDTDTNANGKLSFIGSDNYSAGRKAAELLSTELEKGDKVAIINGALGNPAMDARSKGAHDIFEQKGIDVVAEQPANSDKAKAMEVMENILQNHADIKAVFAGNDDMAIGALQALLQAGMTDVKVVGIDGTEEALQSILNGGLYGSIAQKTYDMGYLAVETALKLTQGEKVEPRIDSGLDVVTIENAQEHLEFLQSLTKY